MATLSEAQLAAFPLVRGFAVVLRDARSLGQHIRFVDGDGGDLAGFPWWDHMETGLKRWTLDRVPLGSRAAPFDDLEQGWQIYIFAEGDHVYVVQGGEPGCHRFARWFRVERAAYLAAWARLLDAVQAEHRSAASLAEALAHPDEVERLSLQGQPMGALPGEIARLRALRFLDVSHCKLTALPEALAGCAALERIEANFNQLASLPAGLFRLPKLRWLALSYNHLTELPEAIGGLGELTILTASSNRLTALPAALFQMAQLRELIVTDNPLRSLPARLDGLVQLTNLNLGANRLPQAERDRVRAAYPALAVHV